jgi:hypothetical protein
MDMRFILTTLLLIACCEARAQDQEQTLAAGVAMTRELAPFLACLNKATSDARPQSNEAALTIAQTSCTDVAATVRLKIAEVHKRFFDPPPPSYGDPEKLFDGTITMTRLKAYWDFTGELKRFQEQLKRSPR